MARVVSRKMMPKVTASIITDFEDGTSSVKIISIGDMTSIRYVEDEEIKVANGRVGKIGLLANTITPVNIKKPVDNFNKDVRIGSIEIDASQEYHSDIHSINGMEVIEDVGVSNVRMVRVSPNLSVDITITYSDESSMTENITVGDYLKDLTFTNGATKADTTGNYIVAAFGYYIYRGECFVDSIYVVPRLGGNAIKLKLNRINSFTVVPHIDVSGSLDDIKTMLSDENIDFVAVRMTGDIDVPLSDQGKLQTVQIPTGKTVDFDLNGYTLQTLAFAFYVVGGTLYLRDSRNGGKITCLQTNQPYAAIQVQGGRCVMDSGIIDTHVPDIDENDHAWVYGVVCTNDGVFEMYGGKILCDESSGISISNITTPGATYTITGNSVLKSDKGCAAYIANQVDLTVSGNAKLYGGILLRMGNIVINGKAYIEGSNIDPENESIPHIVTNSGSAPQSAAITAICGMYNSSIGNDTNISISKYTTIKAKNNSPIVVCLANTVCNQKLNVIVEKSNCLKNIVKFSKISVYEYDELSRLATAAGYTMGAKTSNTEYTITMNDKVLFTNVEEQTNIDEES